MYRIIKSVDPCHSSEDQVKAQADLDSALKWAIDNNMSLNEKKFQLLSHHVHHIAPNRNMRHLLVLPFAEQLTERYYDLPCDSQLHDSEWVSDLGVAVSNDFRFDVHISQISRKANLKCSWVLSVFKSRDRETMLTLYKSVVRSLLEYNSPLWSPSKVSEIAMLEAVQRRLTSKIYSVQHLDYWERLSQLGLMSLQRRRDRYQLLYLWKIINAKVPNDIGIEWRMCNRKGIVVKIPRMPSSVAKINSMYDNSFKVYAAKTWNCLPKSVNTANTLVTFKSKLDDFLLTVQDCPPVAGYSTANRNRLLDWLASANAY